MESKSVGILDPKDTSRERVVWERYMRVCPNCVDAKGGLQLTAFTTA